MASNVLVSSPVRESSGEVAYDNNVLKPVVKFAMNMDHYIMKAKQAAEYIKVMQISMSCAGKCGKRRCRRMFALMEHCSACDSNVCDVVGCNQSKLLLNHVKTCNEIKDNAESSDLSSCKDNKQKCLICGFLNSVGDYDICVNSMAVGCCQSVVKRKLEEEDFKVPMSLPKRFRSDSTTSI